ncbi:MAG: ABC transporter permease [Gammaproteobacteria bacterium]|nr:ABC transporter permease [Gammaproteobacteria bacterium]NIR81769.1 ABC transporter permease [Gammaproteobacteria bacterium]NIR88572.1 ABC transporter permease [Gammaproteobacteria bacterium]NIU02876.1 ABC transporter permease [Gammaproteobacteria bacterium]NIV50398.1 ABC transporter permease subunit [Gammaproteobacteria bacterium]
MRRPTDRAGIACFWLFVAVVLVWMYVPYATLFIYSLHDSLFFSFPIDPTLKWFEQMFTDSELMRVLVYTLQKSLLAAVVSTAVAIPGALAYVRCKFRGDGLYKRLILLPIFFPQLVLGIAILVFLHYLDRLPSTTSMILGESVLLAPIAILVISIQILGYSHEIELAGQDLGGGPWYVFRRITFPLIAPGVFTGFLFAFILSWGNFYVDLYASSSQSTLPPWIYGHMQQGFSPVIPAVSVLSVTVSLVLFLVVTPLVYRKMRAVAR